MHTVIYGADIRFWPTLNICNALSCTFKRDRGCSSFLCIDVECQNRFESVHLVVELLVAVLVAVRVAVLVTVRVAVRVAVHVAVRVAVRACSSACSSACL